MKYVGYLLGALIVIGSFLPWASITIGGESQSMTGFSTSAGKITLVCGVLFLACYYMAEKKMLWKILGALAAFFSALIAFLNYNDVQSAGEIGGLVTIGIGMWITMISSILAIVMVFLVKKPAAVAQTPPAAK